MKRVLQTLLRWYEIESRFLPWREDRDPYRIWISEIILQQTRVAQGLAYYDRFLTEFPDIVLLAAADEQDVLKLWQGLGYYSRARNLHKAAKMVVAQMQGIFPSTFADIQQLPGVGTYTAAAIASFAFGEKVPAIDGNVKRVGARFYGLFEVIGTGKFTRELFGLLTTDMQSADANVFNQSMIEVGALLCLPLNPKCDVCPLNSACVAHLQHLQKQIPVVAKKQKPVTKHFHYVSIEMGGKIAFRKRIEGIWQQLYEFPMIEGDAENLGLDWVTDMLGAVDKILVRGQKLFKHQLTHQTIFATCWYFYISEDKFVNDLDWEWHERSKMLQLPIHRLMEKMIKFT